MSQFSEILSRKDLLCTQCVKTLESMEKVADPRKQEKEQISALLLFMAVVYLCCFIGLIALVHIS